MKQALIKRKHMIILILAALLIMVLSSQVAWGRNSMMAESPWSDYTSGVVLYVLLIGFLVSILLIGGIMVVNLGLMSKRPQDKVGSRNPSDVGILEGCMWPEGEYQVHILPAEEAPPVESAPRELYNLTHDTPETLKSDRDDAA